VDPCFEKSEAQNPKLETNPKFKGSKLKNKSNLPLFLVFFLLIFSARFLFFFPYLLTLLISHLLTFK